MVNRTQVPINKILLGIGKSHDPEKWTVFSVDFSAPINLI